MAFTLESFYVFYPDIVVLLEVGALFLAVTGQRLRDGPGTSRCVNQGQHLTRFRQRLQPLLTALATDPWAAPRCLERNQPGALAGQLLRVTAKGRARLRALANSKPSSQPPGLSSLWIVAR